MNSIRQPRFNRNRLPTFSEVLNELTLEPVDLQSFLEFIHNQQRSGDNLDFLLDVCQHTSLCRRYVRELHRSVRGGTPELETEICKVWSNVLDDVKDSSSSSEYLTCKENFESDKYPEAANSNPYLHLKGEKVTSSSLHSLGSLQSAPQGSRDQLFHGRFDLQTQSSLRIDNVRTRSMSDVRTISGSDIRASAEKIFHTFLLKGSEREINLPLNIISRITKSIQKESCHDPEVFEAAKVYTFEKIERGAFLDFLRYKALGNLVQSSLVFRLIIGLLAVFGGFWAGFLCILLDTPIQRRYWLILPFMIGYYFLCSQKYGTDPILALAGLSEYSFAKCSRIRDPYIQQLLNKRALMVLLFTLLIGCSFIIPFLLVPGKRI